MTALARVEPKAGPLAAPAPLPQATEAALAYWSAKLEPGMTQVLDGTLPAALRQTLARRADDLASALRPATSAEAKTLVASLFAALPQPGQSEEAIRERIGHVVATLADRPAWTIALACQEWRRTKTFPPAPAELYALAVKAAQPVAAEAWRIGRLLTAKERKAIPDDERARLADRAEKLAQSIIGAQPTIMPEPRRPEVMDLTRAKAAMMAQLEAAGMTGGEV